MKQETPDLVIIDMILYPGMNGLETFRKIQEIRPGQRAILTSGHTRTDDVRKAQALGAGQFVPKPYTIVDMGKAIKEELEK
jgi:DNA-binding NarL/FixJ family response regulator